MAISYATEGDTELSFSLNMDLTDAAVRVFFELEGGGSAGEADATIAEGTDGDLSMPGDDLSPGWWVLRFRVTVAGNVSWFPSAPGGELLYVQPRPEGGAD